MTIFSEKKYKLSAWLKTPDRRWEIKFVLLTNTKRALCQDESCDVAAFRPLLHGGYFLCWALVRCIHSLWMWRCCLLPCTQLKDLIHPDESPTYALYCYRFSCRSVQQCFWESIAKLVDGFWILTTLFAAFRNCRSVRSNFTAQAHLCFPLSDDPVNRETSQGKPGKYHTWVGRQKYDGQKSPKSVFIGFANELQNASCWRF